MSSFKELEERLKALEDQGDEASPCRSSRITIVPYGVPDAERQAIMDRVNAANHEKGRRSIWLYGCKPAGEGEDP